MMECTDAKPCVNAIFWRVHLQAMVEQRRQFAHQLFPIVGVCRWRLSREGNARRVAFEQVQLVRDVRAQRWEDEQTFSLIIERHATAPKRPKIDRLAVFAMAGV